MSDYEPRGKTREILKIALLIMDQVPYKVSSRWLFYRLLQEGFYSGKEDYKNKFIKATSRARHAFWEGWTPYTLADETRAPIRRGGGFESIEAWVDDLANGLSCSLNKWYSQEYYIELWFEARAMADQFRHYTDHMTLRPMGGQPSIDFKWQTAKDLEIAARRYENPIIILYFGDLDPAGAAIAQTVEWDVRTWCEEDFDFTYCGLTSEQVKKYNVPENFDKPGQYQWEALSDTAAKEIIENATNQYLRQ